MMMMVMMIMMSRRWWWVHDSEDSNGFSVASQLHGIPLSLVCLFPIPPCELGFSLEFLDSGWACLLDSVIERICMFGRQSMWRMLNMQKEA